MIITGNSVHPSLIDPLLAPDWRQARAQELISCGEPVTDPLYDDIWIETCKSFLLKKKSPGTSIEALRAQEPHIANAFDLYNSHLVDPEMAMIIESRLLSGDSFENIAFSLKAVPETVEWYSKLFFDVPDFLDHHDWIVRQVLLPSARRVLIHESHKTDEEEFRDFIGFEYYLLDESPKKPRKKKKGPVTTPFLDYPLKLFSYFGGPLVCDVMISGFQSRAHVTDISQLTSYFQDQVVAQLSRRAAQASVQFDVNQFNTIELFRVVDSLVANASRFKNLQEAEGQLGDVGDWLESLAPMMDMSLGGITMDGQVVKRGEKHSAEPDYKETMLENLGTPSENFQKAKKRRFQDLQQEGED